MTKNNVPKIRKTVLDLRKSEYQQIMRNMGNQKIVTYPLRNVNYNIHLLQNYECLAIFSARTIQVKLLRLILGRFGPGKISIPAARPTRMGQKIISPVAKMLFTTLRMK